MIINHKPWPTTEWMTMHSLQVQLALYWLHVVSLPTELCWASIIYFHLQEQSITTITCSPGDRQDKSHPPTTTGTRIWPSTSHNSPTTIRYETLPSHTCNLHARPKTVVIRSQQGHLGKCRPPLNCSPLSLLFSLLAKGLGFEPSSAFSLLKSPLDRTRFRHRSLDFFDLPDLILRIRISKIAAGSRSEIFNSILLAVLRIKETLIRLDRYVFSPIYLFHLVSLIVLIVSWSLIRSSNCWFLFFDSDLRAQILDLLFLPCNFNFLIRTWVSLI